MLHEVIKILHVTPHLGGGVGRVLLNYLSNVKQDHNFNHQIACLDYANEDAQEIVRHVGLSLIDKLADNRQYLLSLIAEVDVVIIHWWNHPLLYDVLVRECLPPARIVFWSHVSGFHPPYVFNEKIIHYGDLFVFTTPVSYESESIKNLSEDMRKKLRVIWSTSGVEHVRHLKRKEHKGFNVGYIGTVDYCKMHPDFLKMCSMIDIPDVKFIVCGGHKEKEILNQAKILGIEGRFEFTGLVSNIEKYLAKFDVFGYPLAPYHYGTCDQVLAESMACGIVPVVLANRMERFMVKDGITGIVTNNKEEYRNAIMELYNNEKLRSKLSQNAKDYAYKTFSLDVLKQEWEKVILESLKYPKVARKWDIAFGDTTVTAKDVFLESLGEYGQDFVSYCNASSHEEREISLQKIRNLGKSPTWQAQTRGTVHHYYKFFPKDEILSLWSNVMLNKQEKGS